MFNFKMSTKLFLWSLVTIIASCVAKQKCIPAQPAQYKCTVYKPVLCTAVPGQSLQASSLCLHSGVVRQVTSGGWRGEVGGQVNQHAGAGGYVEDINIVCMYI